MTVYIIKMFDFSYFSMDVRIFWSGLTAWNTHDWVINSKLFKILSRPCTQCINNRYLRFFVKRVLEIRRGFWFISLFFLFRTSLLASRNHFRTYWLFVPIKYYPVWFLPYITIELLVAIKCSYVNFCNPHYISNLKYVW